MKVITVKELLLRHKDTVLSLNLGRLEEALRDLIDAIGPTGENIAFLAKENVFTAKQHIVLDNADGMPEHLTIEPSAITSDADFIINTPKLSRNPLPDNPSDNEIVTYKEIRNLDDKFTELTRYATETHPGIVQLATQTEADTFQEDTHVLTPKKLKPVNDRLVFLENRPNYIIDTVLPEELSKNTIYILTD